MKEKWFVTTKKADFDSWGKAFGISPVLARIIRNRDVTEENEVRKFLNGTLEDCYSPWLLYDMKKAVEVILKAIEDRVAIRVIGDYDVDGICSAYILTKGLQAIGGNVDTAIPHRIHDGYGLNENLIKEAYDDGIRMIVTCDNGISASEQIELANSLGMQVVVTDHHEVPFVTEEGVRKEVLPQALAVVDPKQEKDSYPFPGICGGMVAYKLIQAVCETTNSDSLKECLEELLEFAAMATVCDVMELKDENRIMVSEGLKRMKKTRNQGIAALMEVNGIEPESLAAHHLGFVLGPCLNATGRLDTAHRALELIQSKNKQEAMNAASELKALNDSRKNLTVQGVEEAEEYIHKYHMEEEKVMVIYLPEVHESLAGIIAGRIREKYNRPTFILTKGEEGVKGSGRSIDAYHMYDAMTEVKELFTKFGGHKLAAGLSMEEKDIPVLQEKLNTNCHLTEDDFVVQVRIDVPMPLAYGTVELAEQIGRLEPYGVGNPKPLFAQKDLIFQSARLFGKNKNMARYRVAVPEGGSKQLVCFADVSHFREFLDEKYGEGSFDMLLRGSGQFSVSVVYQLDLNTYMGKTDVQYIMQHYC